MNDIRENARAVREANNEEEGKGSNGMRQKLSYVNLNVHSLKKMCLSYSKEQQNDIFMSL